MRFVLVARSSREDVVPLQRFPSGMFAGRTLRDPPCVSVTATLADYKLLPSPQRNEAVGGGLAV